jgi:hypothetical protein
MALRDDVTASLDKGDVVDRDFDQGTSGLYDDIHEAVRKGDNKLTVETCYVDGEFYYRIGGTYKGE